MTIHTHTSATTTIEPAMAEGTDQEAARARARRQARRSSERVSGTPWMYATDPMARLVAEQALALGHWDRAPADVRMFLLLPFGHSERLEDQERSAALAEALLPYNAEHALHYRDVIRRFGRFPHRNAILGRATTLEEAAYVADGGYAG